MFTHAFTRGRRASEIHESFLNICCRQEVLTGRPERFVDARTGVGWLILGGDNGLSQIGMIF